jgi:bromodomain-containing factor 1
VALNLPLYTTVIKNPMDLGTIAQRLDAKKYSSVSKFVQDVELVFSNCMLFNADGSPVRVVMH